jgi:hypothetical protein
MLNSFDTWLSVVDILICLFDIALIVYLFFYKFPQEQKKNKFVSRLSPRRSRFR